MIEIIPALDLIAGKCVRLTHGDYARKKVYSSDPLQVARTFEAAGLRRLHLVDLDGARTGRIVNHEVLKKIAVSTDLQIDFGGGVQSDADIGLAFDSGATQVTGGSIAVRNRPLFLRWLEKYGPDKIILGADVRRKKIAVAGWRQDSAHTLFDFIRGFCDTALEHVICTDIQRDGTLRGVSAAFYQSLAAAFPHLHIIASGGVSSVRDVEALAGTGVRGVIIGKAFYEEKIQLEQLHPYLSR